MSCWCLQLNVNAAIPATQEPVCSDSIILELQTGIQLSRQSLRFRIKWVWNLKYFFSILLIFPKKILKLFYSIIQCNLHLISDMHFKSDLDRKIAKSGYNSWPMMDPDLTHLANDDQVLMGIYSNMDVIHVVALISI